MSDDITAQDRIAMRQAAATLADDPHAPEVITGAGRGMLRLLDRIDALEAERDRLREALEQAQPWLHYMLHHIAPDWSSSEAEVLRQDVALVDSRLADSKEAPSDGS